ncbi:hypothetical protein JW905_15975, partial [bacterium]|nr:hypothetical protein [candidate division CSSED10-310 bacterium]
MFVVMRWLSIFYSIQARRSFQLGSYPESCNDRRGAWLSTFHGSQAMLSSKGSYNWGRTPNLVMIVVVRWLSTFHGSQAMLSSKGSYSLQRGRTRNLVMFVVMRWLSIFYSIQARRSFQWGRTRNLAMIVAMRWLSTFHGSQAMLSSKGSYPESCNVRRDALAPAGLDTRYHHRKVSGANGSQRSLQRSGYDPISTTHRCEGMP